MAFLEPRHWAACAQPHSATSVAWLRGTTCMGMDERIKPRKHKLSLEGFLKKVAPEKRLGESEGIPGEGTGISNSYQLDYKNKFERLRELELELSVLNDTHWNLQVTVSENSREKARIRVVLKQNPPAWVGVDNVGL